MTETAERIDSEYISLERVHLSQLKKYIRKLNELDLFEDVIDVERESKHDICYEFIVQMEDLFDCGRLGEVDGSVISYFNSLLESDIESVEFDCDLLNPMNDCLDCRNSSTCKSENKFLYSRIPYEFVDKYVGRLSSPALKIFMYLHRRANFSQRNRHFGRCWPKKDEIASATNVSKSNMWKYMQELENYKLIERKILYFPKPEGGISTSVQYKIPSIIKLGPVLYL